MRDEIVHAETLKQVNSYMDFRTSRLISAAVGIALSCGAWLASAR